VNPPKDPEPVTGQGISPGAFAGLVGVIEHGDAYLQCPYDELPRRRDPRLAAVISINIVQTCTVLDQRLRAATDASVHGVRRHVLRRRLVNAHSKACA